LSGAPVQRLPAAAVPLTALPPVAGPAPLSASVQRKPAAGAPPAAPAPAALRAPAPLPPARPQGDAVPALTPRLEAAAAPLSPLARMLAEAVPVDPAKEDLLAVAERALFGPIPPAPLPRRPQAPPHTQARAAAEDSGEVTLRVTIGRLEIVSPAPAPEAPPARRHTAPTLSLQDYLARRQGGQL
jgi:hypothetical protein